MSLQKPTIFTGAATALITPFAEGQIDYKALENLIEWQISSGIGALLFAGTTGESATLNMQELYELIRFAKQHINGRVPLLAGCGSNSTAHAIELANLCCDGGADALLAVTPYYNKTNDNGILQHYSTLANASTRPLILYNVPGRTGYHLTAEHCRKLSAHPNIVGIKEASGNLELIDRLYSESGDRLDIYTGNDHQTVSSMKLGAIGVISVYANLDPHSMVGLCRSCSSGDYHSAEKRIGTLLPKMQALFSEVNPIPVKYVASRMGLCRPEYRLPLCPPTSDVARFLQKIFEKEI